ncbi:MAG: hypothetical protein E7267_02845 [Lachnospiraceae bacterium]|nr:hypothetical protein [Lachnospiraceae bacterium]
MEEYSLIAGFDLGNEYSQISYFDDEKAMPVCIGKDDEEMYIPTVLGVKDTGEWLCGREALYYNELGRCKLVKDFVSLISQEQPVYLDDKVLDPSLLLVTFFKKTLFKLKEYEPNKSIRKIVVAVEKLSEKFAEYIYLALESMGIARSRVEVLSYKQSYLYYVLSHSSNIWVNDVGMFDFNKRGLKYYQITVDRQRTPHIAGIIEKDYTDSLNYEMVNDEKYRDSLGYIFENVVQNAIRRQIISTLYMIGDGFADGWAELVMKKLCGGRRVFVGRNLYVMGACLAARKYEGLGTMKDFVLIDEDMIAAHVSANVYVNAVMQEVILAKAGSIWFESDNTIDVIPDDESEIMINVTNVMTREVSRHFISLEALGLREFDRRNRIRIRVRFQSVNKCIITIKDEGFGELFPSSGRIAERIIEI